MRFAKAVLCGVSTFAISVGAAFAADYPERYGLNRDPIPSSVNEANGQVENPPQQWGSSQSGAAGRSAAGTLDEYFTRYDADRDGMVSWDEAQADGDLVRVFDLADEDRDNALTRGEFNRAASLARQDRRG